MYFDTTFAFAKLCPPKHRKAEVNGCGIERIDVAVEPENRGYTFAPCLVNQVIGKLLEDAVISVLIGSCQGRF